MFLPLLAPIPMTVGASAYPTLDPVVKWAAGIALAVLVLIILYKGAHHAFAGHHGKLASLILVAVVLAAFAADGTSLLTDLGHGVGALFHASVSGGSAPPATPQ